MDSYQRPSAPSQRDFILRTTPMISDTLQLGREYSRREIAEMLGYRGFEALTSGVICPLNSREIILFVNRESRPDLPQYSNHFDGEVLEADGRKSSL